MHSFEVHSNESACRKVDVLSWNKSKIYYKMAQVSQPLLLSNGGLYFELCSNYLYLLFFSVVCSVQIQYVSPCSRKPL